MSEAFESDDSEDSPLVNKVQRFDRARLGNLISANFSTDSISEIDENLLNQSDIHERNNNSQTLLFPNEPESPIRTVNTRNSRRLAAPPIVPPINVSRSSSPTRATSPTRMNRQFKGKSPKRRGSPTKTYQPFNFQSQEVVMNQNGQLNIKPAHRKGHKYKHSSVSMNYFQEPEKAAIRNVSDSYPIPTFKEGMKSLTSNQKYKVGWSIIHLLGSVSVFIIGNKINVGELGTLAHLIFYDSLGCWVITFVDIMSNFEVWNNSSIVFPFGLSRLEVLIGFSLGASLIMVGFDLLSHNFEEFILFVFQMDETSHSHHIHSSTPNTSITYFLTLFFTLIITLITSNYILAAKKINRIIKGHNREISNLGFLNELPKEDRFERFNKFISIIIKNPTYILTLVYTTFLIISPIISDLILRNFELDINELASLVISLLFCLTGWKLVQALGNMLLLSYPSSAYEYDQLKKSIINEIIGLENFKSGFKLTEFHMSKFNYDVFVVGVKLNMVGSSIDQETVTKYDITKLIKGKVSRRQKDFKLELTIDIDR